jgi:hypothetical protein
MPFGTCFYRDCKSDNVKKAALQMPLNGGIDNYIEQRKNEIIND